MPSQVTPSLKEQIAKCSMELFAPRNQPAIGTLITASTDATDLIIDPDSESERDGIMKARTVQTESFNGTYFVGFGVDGSPAGDAVLLNPLVALGIIPDTMDAGLGNMLYPMLIHQVPHGTPRGPHGSPLPTEVYYP